MIKNLILIVIILFLIFPAKAKDNFIFSTSTYIGERTTSQDYEEEDTDYSYRYNGYNFNIKYKKPNLNYFLGSSINKKDYKTKDYLDNISRLLKTELLYYLKKDKINYTELNTELNYKEKRYKNSPNYEYNRITLIPTIKFKRKDQYISLIFGIDSFSYLEDTDKDKIKIMGGFEIKKYLLEKKIVLLLSYRQEFNKQENNTRKNKNKFKSEFSYVFNKPLIYKITTGIDFKDLDTKEKDIDQDLEYRYFKYYIKTEHRINKRLETSLKYERFKKNYTENSLDNSGFLIKNNWDYEILKNKDNKINFDFDLGYEEKNYELEDQSYKKKTMGFDIFYQRKDSHKLKFGIEKIFYNFEEKINNKNKTAFKFGIEKFLFNRDLSLGLDLKYKILDYKSAKDEKQKEIKFSFIYKF